MANLKFSETTNEHSRGLFMGNIFIPQGMDIVRKLGTTVPTDFEE